MPVVNNEKDAEIDSSTEEAAVSASLGAVEEESKDQEENETNEIQIGDYKVLYNAEQSETRRDLNVNPELTK